MKHAPFARGHGRKGERSVCGAHFLDGYFRHHFKFAVAIGFEAFCVERDAVVTLGFEAEDLGGDVLDCVEEFAVAGQEEGSIGPGEFNFDFGISIGGWSGDRGDCTGWGAGGGLHLAVAGKDLRVEPQAACSAQHIQEI